MNLEVDITGFSRAIPINIFGFEFVLFREMIFVAISLLVVLVIAILIGIASDKQDPRKKPAPILVIAEWLWNFSGGDVTQLSSENPKEHKMMLHVYATNIFIFIFVANTMSLWGGHSPAANVFVSIGLGIMVLFLVHGLGLAGGIGGYFKSYFKPFPIFFPINIITAVSEVISISMRLFGNTLAAMILAELLKQSILMITGLGYFIYPIAGGALMLYDIFIAYIQSLLFMRLSMTYIREKLPLEEE